MSSTHTPLPCTDFLWVPERRWDHPEDGSPMRDWAAVSCRTLPGAHHGHVLCLIMEVHEVHQREPGAPLDALLPGVAGHAIEFRLAEWSHEVAAGRIIPLPALVDDARGILDEWGIHEISSHPELSPYPVARVREAIILALCRAKLDPGSPAGRHMGRRILGGLLQTQGGAA